jgi:hypothetical protein
MSRLEVVQEPHISEISQMNDHVDVPQLTLNFIRKRL